VEVGGTDPLRDGVQVEGRRIGRRRRAARVRRRDLGENVSPSAQLFRLMPRFFVRDLLTSRIWTSTMTSARGLSFALMIRSITSTIGAVARTVIVLDVLFGSSAGC